MFENELTKIVSKIPQLKNDRNYWLVRTNGGEYYEDFKKNDLIGIGWNSYKIEDIKKIVSESDDHQKALSEYIKKYSKEEEPLPGYAASQIIRFMFGIQENDVIIIPSTSSDFLTFGYVSDNNTYTKNDLRKYKEISSPLNKFRKVNWEKTIVKGFLEPELYKMLFSHHPISMVTEYDIFIDRLLNSFYEKNNQYHYIINIESQNKISGRDLFRTWLDIFDLVDEFNSENGVDSSSYEIEAKIKVQSPGIIEFIASNPESLIIIGLILVFIVGGGLEFNHPKFPLKIKTDGLIKKLTEFLNDKSKRKMINKLFDKSINELNIRNSSSFIKLLEKISNEKDD